MSHGIVSIGVSGGSMPKLIVPILLSIEGLNWKRIRLFMVSVVVNFLCIDMFRLMKDMCHLITRIQTQVRLDSTLCKDAEEHYFSPPTTILQGILGQYIKLLPPALKDSVLVVDILD